MFGPTTMKEIACIGLFLEGFLYGLYSGIFAMYLQCQASKKDIKKSQNIIFYSMCALYVLSVAVFVCDIAGFIYKSLLPKPLDSLLRIAFIRTTSFGCCDFIAQFILIYRCWIVWGCNIRVVIIPSILTLAFLGTWLSSNGSEYILSDLLEFRHWGCLTNLTSLALSLTANALVTGLIVFRICKEFLEVKTASGGQNLGATGGSKLRRTILVLIESGMALFSIQLARLVVTTSSAPKALFIISSIHEMLNGIIPTIILVRNSMALSFQDEKPTEEVSIESMHFASNQSLNSVPETGSINIVARGSRYDDDIQRSSESDEHI